MFTNALPRRLKIFKKVLFLNGKGTETAVDIAH